MEDQAPSQPPAVTLPSAAQLGVDAVQVTGDGSCTVYSPRFGQTYGSQHGAEAQARVVFVEGSGVTQAQHGRVLEIGFGIGQNLRATLAARGQRPLDYVAHEFDPVSAEVLAAVSQGAVGAEHPLWQKLLAAWPAWVAGGKAQLEVQDGPQRVRVVRGDALQAAFAPAWAEAVYLDGFSPSANPELWSPEFLARLAGGLAVGGVLATYSAAGRVRRALTAAGLDVEKRAGPPGKREVVRAVRRETVGHEAVQRDG